MLEASDGSGIRTCGQRSSRGAAAGSDGKLDSVAIIALGSGANVPLVLAIQTMRAFFVILHRPDD
jgi:hypothetical protein